MHELHQSDKLLFKVEVTKHFTRDHPKQTVQLKQKNIVNLQAAHFVWGERSPSASDGLRFWRRDEKLCILKLDDTLSNSKFLVSFDSISRVKLQIST